MESATAMFERALLSYGAKLNNGYIIGQVKDLSKKELELLHSKLFYVFTLFLFPRLYQNKRNINW